MAVALLYFASLRERIGTGAEALDLPDGVDRVDRLMDYLATRDAPHAAAFARRAAIRCAVNQEFATLQTPVADRDEVAFFPPVTGG